MPEKLLDDLTKISSCRIKMIFFHSMPTVFSFLKLSLKSITFEVSTQCRSQQGIEQNINKDYHDRVILIIYRVNNYL